MKSLGYQQEFGNLKRVDKIGKYNKSVEPINYPTGDLLTHFKR